MVSKAIDEGLIKRIQTYVATDINSKIVMRGDDEPLKVQPEDIYILSFERILNNWQAIATAEGDIASFYKITHDGDTDKNLVVIYIRQNNVTHEAII